MIEVIMLNQSDLRRDAKTKDEMTNQERERLLARETSRKLFFFAVSGRTPVLLKVNFMQSTSCSPLHAKCAKSECFRPRTRKRIENNQQPLDSKV